MIDPRTREIRAILIGWVRYEGIYCIASEGMSDMHFRGLNNGAEAARMRGLKGLRQQYVIPRKFGKGIEFYNQIITACGQRVFLRSSPQALAALCRPFLLLAPPVVVTLEFGEDNQMLFCYETARTLLARLRLRHVANKVRNLLPGVIEETALTMEPTSEEFIKGKAEEMPKKEKKHGKKKEAAPAPVEEPEEEDNEQAEDEEAEDEEN